MKKIFIITTGISLLLTIFSCSNIKEGFLMTENAAFHPDSLVIPVLLDSIVYADMHENQAPFLSIPISGAKGTAPVKFKVTSVHADNGYTKAISDISATLDGRIQIKYGYTLPVGIYRVDLEIYNEGHSAIIPDSFKIIVTDETNY